MEHRIIFATGNAGKMKEVRMILGELGIPVLSMKEAGIAADIVENGKSFEENAVIKAEAIRDLTADGDLVLADDSGLEIDYLDGAPGIYSARFMGEDTCYTIKNTALVEKLAGVPEEKRTARFVCAIACAFPDGHTITTRGVMEGIIAQEIRHEEQLRAILAGKNAAAMDLDMTRFFIFRNLAAHRRRLHRSRKMK